MNDEEFEQKIATGWFRSKYGLDTTRDSLWFKLRQDGMSDLEAQKRCFAHERRMLDRETVSQ